MAGNLAWDGGCAYPKHDIAAGLTAPSALMPLLADYAEALAGLTVGESGAPEAVPDRVSRVQAWNLAQKRAEADAAER